MHGREMVGSFGRPISYVRLSVIDRWDLRCRYCMAERMVFLPKSEILNENTGAKPPPRRIASTGSSGDLPRMRAPAITIHMVSGHKILTLEKWCPGEDYRTALLTI